MTATRFAIVGVGWRAEFYLRIARALPQRFELGAAVVRDAAKGKAVERRWGIETFRTVDDLLRQYRPQFVVTCVPWEANPSVIEDLAASDVPILSETPPAADLPRLRDLWALSQQGARVQVAEQYIHQPHHAARLAFVQSGKLGIVTQAQVSACHGYHGVSLIRHYLGVGLKPVSIRARTFQAPLIEGPGRDGPPRQERLKESSQTIAWLDFGDKLGVYDFSGDQYFSWVRNERLLVRGERGEIIDQRANYLLHFDQPVEVAFRRINAGEDGNLEGHHLKGILAGEWWAYRNPFIPARLTDDELAIATCLSKMAEYLEGGAPVYSLAEACHDRYLDILIAKAAECGQIVESQPQPWEDG